MHCGVQLPSGTAKCPLCATVFPVAAAPHNVTPAVLPPKRKLRREGVLFIITVYLLLVAGISLGIDLYMHGKPTWSGYVAGGLLLCYMGSIFPLWVRKANPLLYILAESGAVALYLFCLERTLEGGWYLPFALPLTALLCLFAMTLTAFARRFPAQGIMLTSGGWFATGLCAVLAECLALSAFGGTALVWSPWVGLGCALMSVWFLLVARCVPLQEWLVKRLFV